MNLLKLFITLLGVHFLTFNSQAAEFQNHETIYTAAKEYIQNNYTPQNEYELTLSSLDPRLQLPLCEKPLEAFVSNTSLKPGRNSIGVRCNAQLSWLLYLIATLKVYENIAVLTQPVKRGEIITEQQLTLTKQEISQLRSGFITDINTVINQQATRNLAPGIPISNKDFTKAIIIKRGDTVMITTNKSQLTIQMTGSAMSDGAQGQSIRIKNTSSGRIITATVVQAGVVSVNY